MGAGRTDVGGRGRRRGRLLGMLLAIALAATPAWGSADHADTATTVEVDEGTNIAATVAPDGRRIVFDLHGILFGVRRRGGPATALTDVELEPSRPVWSPRGDRIAFQAYADGNFHVWTMAPDGSHLRQVTDGPFDDREPTWAPDGRSIAFASDRAGSYDIWTVDLRHGRLRRWTDADTEESEPTWTRRGNRIAYVVDGTRVDASGRGRPPRTFVDAGDQTVNAPSWSPDGRHLAHVQSDGLTSTLRVDGEVVGGSEDVFPFPAAWLSPGRLLHTADGRMRTLSLRTGAEHDIPFTADLPVARDDGTRKAFDFDERAPHPVHGIVSPRLAPDGRRVAFIALNDVWVMRIGRRPQRVTDDDFYESDVAWSRDGTRLAYSSDRAGTPDIYVRDLSSGDDRAVTDLPGAEVASAWSPDGERLAFQDQDGITYVLDLASGAVEQIDDVFFQPGRPTWSADGGTVAFAALDPYSARFREGTSKFRIVDLAGGGASFVAPLPQDVHASIATRGDDGPVWSPDGRRIASVVDGMLWLTPVDGEGRPTGDARQVTREATDSPSWSGDSRSLLYLHNGTLRLLDLARRTTRDIPVDLRWRRDVPDDTYVIHAGRLWDGTGEDVHSDVDITVSGNRITGVAPHSDDAHAGTVVDASDRTVLPGLVDMHVHQEYSAKFFGDRQGRISLAYGITTTHSTGDPVYRAVEDRESLRSGARVGPRLFTTGEALDGSRVYYNFMRPVRSVRQLRLERSRAQALDYDMLKTYVRLPASLMARATDAAHALGITAQSHYMAPGAFVGQDGTTHLSATQRLGYARTESLTQRTYDDVLAVYEQGDKTIMTTFFDAFVLLADDPALVTTDARVTQLYPSWEEDLVAEQLATAQAGEPVTEERLRREAQTFAELYDRGVTVLAGTDSPIASLGLSLHLNLRTLVANGLTPVQALRTATVLPARSLAIDDDLGTIEAGKLADLLVVDGDPLTDIDDLVDVRAVVHDGVVDTPASLAAPYTAGD